MIGRPTERVDLAIIEALDFEYTPQCEHAAHEQQPQFHGGPDCALVHVNYGCCGRSVDHYVCAPWLAYIRRSGPVRCPDCWTRYAPYEHTVIAWVNQ
jgi:hypothetical protein